ncbi:MAG: hypothetical protein ABIJ92_04930 [Candidatus Aenigmatarchaeota archaeon]
MVREKIFCMPIPSLGSEDISLLTEKRQKILISLLHGKNTLSGIIADIKTRDKIEIEISTVLKGLRKLEEKGFIERTQNKVYELTEDGKLLALFLARPNGIKEETIIQELDNMLKEKNPELTEEERKETIENLREDVSNLF